MSVKFNAEKKPFRVRIVGYAHPYRGAKGTGDPNHVVYCGIPFALVRLDDEPSVWLLRS